MNQKWLRPMIRKKIRKLNSEIPQVISSYRKSVNDSLSQIVRPRIKSELDVSRVARQARPIYRVACRTSTVPCPLRAGTAFNQVTDTFGKDQGQVRYLCCLTEFMVHIMRIDA